MPKLTPAQMRAHLLALQMAARAMNPLIRGQVAPILAPVFDLVGAMVDTLEHQGRLLEVQARALADMEGDFMSEDGALPELAASELAPRRLIPQAL